MNNTDMKDELSVHVILEASDYTKIKTSERGKVGQPREPIAKLPELGGNARKCSSKNLDS